MHQPSIETNQIKNTIIIKDSNERIKALNTKKSFIIQAPAGSGKTQILTSRVLNLLASAVNNPEEILAITFTNKAAKEMLHRIKSALLLAEKPEPNKNDLLKYDLWKLACKVKKQDIKHNWNLKTSINRINIMTFDAFCARLTSLMPHLSKLGGLSKMSNDPHKLYEKAAIAFINDKKSPLWEKHIPEVLLPLNNNIEKFIRLSCDLLAKREQWLPLIANLNSSANNLINNNIINNLLQSSITQLHENILIQAYDIFEQIPELIKKDIFNICEFVFDDFDFNNINSLKNTANILLTKDNSWRLKLNKKQGIISNVDIKLLKNTGNKDDLHKSQIATQIKEISKDLLEEINNNQFIYSQLKEYLILIKNIPNNKINNLSVLDALTNILPVLAAHFRVICEQAKQTDFNEIALSSLNALGSLDQPSDLNLMLDYQIRHLLVDEFQDTSQLQFSLIERLVSEWEENDDKTLFFVGDPMQSIYRFRQADVSLFLEVKQNGIANKQCEFLELKSNFRTQSGLLKWINKTCYKIFPEIEMPQIGAVSYTQAYPVIPEISNKAVNLYDINNLTNNIDNNQISNILKKIISENKDIKSKIAILVRSRGHLIDIIPGLIANNLKFNALEIESLAENKLISDYISLALAISSCADEISWYALLRGPLFALNKKQLKYISDQLNNNKLNIIDALNNHNIINITKYNVLLNAIKNRNKNNFIKILDKTWIKLGGPALYKSPEDQANIKLISKLLDKNNMALSNLHLDIESRIKSIFASATNPNAYIEIMTIHKSKGLEFDHVIIPSLEKSTKSDQSPMMLWQSNIHKQVEPYLLIAPMATNDPLFKEIYDYLRYIEQKKSEQESMRLFYVAITRAKKTLHLCFDSDKNNNIANSKDNNKKTRKNSFLGYISDYLDNNLNNNPNNNSISILNNINHNKLSKNIDSEINNINYLTQVDTNLINLLNNNKQNFINNNKSNNIYNHPELIKQNDFAKKQYGIAFHKCIEILANINFDKWPKKIKHIISSLKYKLMQIGISKQNAEAGVYKITQALNNMTNCKYAKWIFNQTHIRREHEFSLEKADNINKNNKIKKGTIDCWFIDKSNNIFIIDFKLSDISDKKDTMSDISDKDTLKFLKAQKQAYSGQLERYKKDLADYLNIPTRPSFNNIKIYLYFPLLKRII